MSSDKVIGIDLGTTYSCVAVLEGGKPVVIVNAEGSRTTPSVVGFSRTGECIVGHVAKRQAVTNPARTVQSIKRKMGSNQRITIDNVSYSPEQISARILQKLRSDAAAYIGEEVTKAVITVPAYFNDSERQATRAAGEIAGLDVLRIINEPTASALAFGFDKLSENTTVLVYDLGGGTFDVSILQITDRVFEVKATSGNNHLGGDDFDNALIAHFQAEFLANTGIDLSADLMAQQRLRESAERAKIELSTALTSEVHLPFLTADASGPRHFETTITRSKFNELTHHLVEQTMGPLETALADAGLSCDQIDDILLVGGSSRIPAVQDAIKRHFQKEPVKSVNQDEAVALGAAIQASILSGEVQDVLLLDVIPLALGVETGGGLWTKVVEHNTTIPTSRTMSFTTTTDGQTSVEIHILQGVREFARDNISLGRFYIEDIPRAPLGIPKIEVTFDLDADGILHVTGRDAGTGKKQSITIKHSSRLSASEIERLQSEAQQFAQHDIEQKEMIAAKIKAEILVSDAQRTIEKYATKVDTRYINDIQTALMPVKAAMQGEPSPEFKNLVDHLDQALLDLGKAIYSSGGGE